MTARTGSRKPPAAADLKAVGSSTFADAVHRIRSEAGGLLQTMIVQPADFAFVVEEAAAGDPDAVRVLATIEDAVRRITAAPRRSPMHCASCPRPLLKKTAFAFAVVEASRENPTSGLAIAVCLRCATTPEQVRERAVTAMRKVWPDLDLRPIVLTHPTGGRA